MRYTNCITCLYTIVNGAVQETGAEGCSAICDAENATIIADDNIDGPNDSRLDGNITCQASRVDGVCSIEFYVMPNSDGSANISVSKSPARECSNSVT